MTVLDTEQLLPGRPSNLTVWGETDSSTLVCRQVHDVTHDVKTFLFEPAQPALFHHEPGQSAGATRSPHRRRARTCSGSR